MLALLALALAGAAGPAAGAGHAATALAMPGATAAPTALDEAPPIECVGDACQPLPEAPEDPSPGTLIPGPPNPPLRFPKLRCARGRHRVVRHGRARCAAARPRHRQHRRGRR